MPTNEKFAPYTGSFFQCLGYSASNEYARALGLKDESTAMERCRVSWDFYNWINKQYTCLKPILQAAFRNI
jgi:hypothetical protein